MVTERFSNGHDDVAYGHLVGTVLVCMDAGYQRADSGMAGYCGHRA
jgi:hypothetical protein